MRSEKQFANLLAQAKRRAAATHCEKGHEYGSKHPKRQRRCLECHNASARRSRAKAGNRPTRQRRLGREIVCLLATLDASKISAARFIIAAQQAAQRNGLA